MGKIGVPRTLKGLSHSYLKENPKIGSSFQHLVDRLLDIALDKHGHLARLKIVPYTERMTVVDVDDDKIRKVRKLIATERTLWVSADELVRDLLRALLIYKVIHLPPATTFPKRGRPGQQALTHKPR